MKNEKLFFTFLFLVNLLALTESSTSFYLTIGITTIYCTLLSFDKLDLIAKYV